MQTFNTQPSQEPGSQAGAETERHEGGLRHVAGNVGHVVFEAASLVFAHHSHKAEAATSVGVVSVDRRHDPGDFTAFSHPVPSAWGSERRT